MKPLVALSIAIAIIQTAPEQPPAAPIDVVLMVDVSSSITQGVFKRDASLITDAASALASVMARGDSARVGTFGNGIRLASAAVSDPEGIQKAATALTETIGGASPLWDALGASSVALSSGGPRRGIIVLTDGRSSANRMSFGDVLTKLETARVAVFVVGLESGASPEPNPTARLSYLADVTGGAYRPVKRKDVADAVKQAVAALRAGATATAR
jgi:uncharacterized protein (DUF58 family)